MNLDVKFSRRMPNSLSSRESDPASCCARHCGFTRTHKDFVDATVPGFEELDRVLQAFHNQEFLSNAGPEDLVQFEQQILAAKDKLHESADEATEAAEAAEASEAADRPVNKGKGLAEDTRDVRSLRWTDENGIMHDGTTMKILHDFYVPQYAPGFLHPSQDYRFLFGPTGHGSKATRLWNGDRANGLLPLKRNRIMLSLSEVPITGLDWSDLSMKPLVGVFKPWGQRAVYLVDGVALRTKYGAHITRGDFEHLGPGMVGVIAAERWPITSTRYGYKFNLAAAAPNWAFKRVLWKPPNDASSSQPIELD
ncbi:hypothetical protein BCV70DRAFT_67819 [Testicularia cyperi]|uniref:Uncharacterized protein n=1 Tax=Testicularia cyperi TaxID=1882483 RepID=A0A317XHS4_9BASI|nr:hypothetical protein BCV70DRAFT_67819 [Testicularia cyperi]